MFNASELIDQVRGSVHEYDANPLTDDQIIARLNRAYSFAYNQLVRSNASLFSEWRYYTITRNITEYPLPKDIYNKRIYKVFTPVPNYDPQTPSGWIEVQRADTEDIMAYQSNRLTVHYPFKWTQLNDMFVIAPTPIADTVFKVQVTQMLVPMAKIQGQIVDIVGNVLYLDRSPDANMAANSSRRGMNLLSISDEMTGRVKALYPYSEVDGESVTLSDNFPRNSVKEKNIRRAYKVSNATKIDYDPVAKTCFALLNQNITSFVSVGDMVEIKRADSGSFNIKDSLITPDDFYDPPEYVLGDDTFSSAGKVVEVGTNYVKWADTKCVPDFVNGYPRGYDDGTYFGTIASISMGTISGNPVVIVNTSVPHRLPSGPMLKIDFAGTGTDIDGTQKCHITGTSQIAILQGSYSGVFTPGTWVLYQYSSLLVGTGWPVIYDISPGTPSVSLIDIYAGTPNIYSSLPGRTRDIPDEDSITGEGIVGVYDHMNDIKIGDWVTLNYTTGIPRHCDLIAELLVFYVSLTLKSSLGESDPEMLAILKEKVNELFSDTDGRNLAIEMHRPYVSSTANRSRGVR
jgi:hypothetical protein